MFAFTVMLCPAVSEISPAPGADSVASSVILPPVVLTVMVPDEIVPDKKVTVFVPDPALVLLIAIELARSAFVLKPSTAPESPPSAVVPVAVQVLAPPESVNWYAGAPPVLTTLRFSFVPRDTVRSPAPSQL